MVSKPNTKAKPKAKAAVKVTAPKPVAPPTTPYPVKVSEPEKGYTPPPTAPKSITPPHYTEIPNFRWIDDAGNVYQLDTYMTRGTYILRVLTKGQ